MQARPLPTVRPTPDTVADVRVELRLGLTGELSLAWVDDPGARARTFDAQTLADLDDLARATAEAEARRELAAIAVARRELGERLFALLDGPERALTRQLEQAAADGNKLELTVALRGRGIACLARHPAAKWRWELLADEHGPVMVRRERTLAVQLGDIRSSRPQTLAYGGLRILFLAYSPRGVEPELDFEGEEERLLIALAPFTKDGRAQVVVVEFGSLDDLREALLGREFDVVHLSGHGMLRAEGPVLLMEDRVGDVDWVTPARLLEVFEQAASMPKLVMISSCLSAGERDDIPSLTTQLVAGGVPAAIGWIQTIRDDQASQAAADIYQRLCTGATPADAVAFARSRLHAGDPAGSPQQAANAWGTLHLVTRDSAGFVVDRTHLRPSVTPIDHRETYQYLDQQGGMRVLETGFVGRRRPLQRMLRVLLDGVEGGIRRAGARLYGNKGTGKSCLAARAIQRVVNGLEDRSELGIIVLHGELDDALVFGQFERQAKRWDDPQAAALLRDGSRGSLVERLSWLLDGRWAGRRLVIVLDDFEQNLATQAEGLAKLSGYAAALLEVLLPACRTNRAKLLVTTTALFELPSAEAERQPLIEVGLGSFEPASLNKLWWRGQLGEDGAVGELAHILPGEWLGLCKRLGRNPRILDWARTLLRGKTTREIEEVVEKAGAAMPEWAAGELPSDAQRDELAQLFLCHMAYDQAVACVSEDARTFVKRARVYEVPVPSEALEGLCDGLDLDLELHLPALQNLGLLEIGELDEEPAALVSRLVEPEFAVENAERWHGVAAAFWARPERHCRRIERMTMAWEHALGGRCEALAGEISVSISIALDRAHLHRKSIQLAQRHLMVFPEAEAGLAWVGYALFRSGDPVAGWSSFERAEAMALSRGASERELAQIFDAGGRILAALGRHEEAASRLTRALALVDQLSGQESPRFAGLLHELAEVLKAQGDLSGARERLERSLTILTKLFGTDEHPAVAASLHDLGNVLDAQGDLSGARERLERSLTILTKLFGTDEHPEVATSLHSLARVLKTQGDLSGARERLERCLCIEAKVFGTDLHPNVAFSLHALAVLLEAEGRSEDAIATFRRVLEIRAKVYGTSDHYISAETEVLLARLLFQRGQTDEAVTLLLHAKAVFEQQVPGHPLLAQLRRLFDESPGHPTLHQLAHLVLKARSNTPLDHADRRRLADGVEALAAAGPPDDSVAAYLRAIADAKILPPIPPDLPDYVTEFLHTVREAAQAINTPQ